MNFPVPPTVVINNITVPVELATKSSEIKKGLSGRPSLAANRGMLFIFSKSARYRFWMLDMHFPIDIIWIDDNAVVSVTANIAATFDAVVPFRHSPIRWLFRRRRPIFYAPPNPVHYVLEVNAGFAAKHGIVPDSPVALQNISPLS